MDMGRLRTKVRVRKNDMAKHISLSAACAWVELQTAEEDWRLSSPTLLATMLTQLHLIRGFEEAVLDLAGEGLVHGPAHSSIGQEGGAVGSIVSLAARDQVNGSHRGHHQFLAKAIHYVSPAGLDPKADFSDEIRQVLHKTLAEILGLSQGYCHGRGGSMHLQWIEAGAMGTNAIVGGGVPMAAGFAWADKHAGTDAVSVSYFGDGATNIGSVLETMNLAAAWKLPICFFIENNQYAVATSVQESTAEPRLSARGLAFNIPSWKVDGMDPLAVNLAMNEALAHMRSGQGPTLIEADVYRFFHQNGPFPGSAFGYRGKEEEHAWRQRDPLKQLADRMIALGQITQDDVSALKQRVQRVMQDVVAELTEVVSDGKKKTRRIRDACWPKPEFCDVGIRGDAHEFSDARLEQEDSYSGPMERKKYIEVVASIMDHRMAQDAAIVVMGEDIHRLKGGTNGATRGLWERYPERVIGTPISENAFVGLAGGLALDGRFKPVVEFMYPDFMWVAADQVFNQIAKARHMFGGHADMPLVLRTKIAMGTGYGSQHSMDPAGIFATSPGWRIAAPSTPFDYIGMMNAALTCKDPVLVLEHVDLYAMSGDVPKNDLDYCLAPAHAAIRRKGADLTLLTYSYMVHESMAAVQETGIDAEVIDLRWLDAASLDWETVGDSIRKTNNVVIVEQGARGTSYGSWLADEIQRRYFDWLDQPVQRVTGAEASPSISKVLERAAIAGAREVADRLREMMRAVGRSA